MWLLGHTVFSYLLVRLIFTINKKELDPNVILFVFVFGNITDALHFGFLRTLLHSPVGTICFSLFWLVVFRKLKLIEKKDFPVLLFVTGVHVLLDVVFSSYFLLFPVSTTVYSVYGWNSAEDLIAEGAAAIVFGLVFLLSGDYYRMRNFIATKKSQFLRDFSLRRLFDPSSLRLGVFGVFCVFVGVQFLFFLLIDYTLLVTWVWYAWMFLTAFLMFIGILGAVLLSQ